MLVGILIIGAALGFISSLIMSLTGASLATVFATYVLVGSFSTLCLMILATRKTQPRVNAKAQELVTQSV